MAKSSLNLREIPPNDVLFITIDHSDGSFYIGTNFTELGRIVKLTHKESVAAVRFLLEAEFRTVVGRDIRRLNFSFLKSLHRFGGR